MYNMMYMHPVSGYVNVCKHITYIYIVAHPRHENDNLFSEVMQHCIYVMSHSLSSSIYLPIFMIYICESMSPTPTPNAHLSLRLQDKPARNKGCVRDTLMGPPRHLYAEMAAQHQMPWPSLCGARTTSPRFSLWQPPRATPSPISVAQHATTTWTWKEWASNKSQWDPRAHHASVISTSDKPTIGIISVVRNGAKGQR